MPEYLFCDQTFGAQGLQQSCGISINDVMTLGCQRPSTISSYTPYLLKNGSEDAQAQNYLGQLSDHKVRRNLGDLVVNYGGEATSAVAGVYNKYGAEFNLSMVGASISLYTERTDGFGKAIKEYQEMLLQYREAAKAKSPHLLLVKHRVHVAFEKMQKQFGHELKLVAGNNTSRRGTPFTNPQRAMNIAQDSRHAKKLFVANQAQANNLIKFSRHAKYLGNGLTVIDLISRAGNVHNEYKAGGQWERELFAESLSLGTSTAASAALVKLGAGAIGFFTVATPVGWVGLIIGGVAVAGTAALGGMATNHFFKKHSNHIYDHIMGWFP